MEKRAQNLSNMFRDQTEELKRIETTVDLEAQNKRIEEKLQNSMKIYKMQLRKRCNL